jgi:uncharacterized membrane protein HdeD (DUF308 family)
MEEAATRSRGALALRGCISFGIGVAALTWPRLTLAVLILLFGFYAISDGVLAIVSAVSDPRQRDRAWPALLEGLLGVAAGLLFLLAPATAAKLAFVLIGLWAIATGVMQLVEAPQLQRPESDSGLLALSGLVRVLLGIFLIARPHAGLKMLIWLVAAYAFVDGVLMLGLALRGKRRGPLVQQPT